MKISQTEERGVQRVKIQNISRGSAIGALCFGNRSLFILNHLHSSFKGFPKSSSEKSISAFFQFVETFIIEANATVHPRLRFSVFDLANFTSKDLRKHDFIGSLEIELETLLESDCGTLIRTLRLPGDVKSRGYIHIYVDDVRESRTNVRLHFGAANLAKKGLLGKCDAFYEVNRLVTKGGHFHPVYRSEVVTRTASPK